jgi:hypothetical protein
MSKTDTVIERKEISPADIFVLDSGFISRFTFFPHILVAIIPAKVTNDLPSPSHEDTAL